MTSYKLPMIALLSALILTACGPRGRDGEQGVPGRTVYGTNGVDGTPGVTGPTGPQGSPGSNGTNGSDGVDASGISIVQFCNGCIPSYPSVFSEIGMCYLGKIYATYSANGGFQAEMPPGAYSSNGIGCSCTFTITSNCGVSQ